MRELATPGNEIKKKEIQKIEMRELATPGNEIKKKRNTEN
jgi:hypothetical protein